MSKERLDMEAGTTCISERKRMTKAQGAQSLKAADLGGKERGDYHVPLRVSALEPSVAAAYQLDNSARARMHQCDMLFIRRHTPA